MGKKVETQQESARKAIRTSIRGLWSDEEISTEMKRRASHRVHIDDLAGNDGGMRLEFVAEDRNPAPAKMLEPDPAPRMSEKDVIDYCKAQGASDTVVEMVLDWRRKGGFI